MNKKSNKAKTEDQSPATEETATCEAVLEKAVVAGPHLYKRNKYNLLDNVEYIFNEDGSVNWRAMIKPEFLYPNKGWFDTRKKPVPSDIEGLDDKQLLIMLAGIKEIARLRGFSNVSYEVQTINENYVVARCRIEWIPNFETKFFGQDQDAYGVTYEEVANATANNTDSFCLKFLETIACNRAFVRCVRNFLNIHIVGADEIDKSGGSSNTSTEDIIESNIVPITPTAILEKICAEKLGITDFNQFKEKLRELWKADLYKNESIKDWNNFADIPAKESRTLLGILSKK